MKYLYNADNNTERFIATRQKDIKELEEVLKAYKSVKPSTDKLKPYIVGADIPQIVDSVITNTERRIKELKRDIELAMK